MHEKHLLHREVSATEEAEAALAGASDPVVFEMQAVQAAGRGELGLDDPAIAEQLDRAQRGDPHAQEMMGDLFYWGARGVPRDHAAARGWFMRAADHGGVNALVAAASMLLKGEGGPADNKIAVELYQEAQDKGSAKASNGLGYAYFFGQGGLEQNRTTALALFRRAMADGHAAGDSLAAGEAAANAAYCILNGHDSALNGSVSLAQEQGRALYVRCARSWGNFQCVYSSGHLILDGIGGPRDATQALQYLRAASDLGPWGSQLRGGFDRYLQGDFESALVAYARSRALHGEGVAAGNVAYLLHKRLAGELFAALGGGAAEASEE